MKNMNQKEKKMLLQENEKFKRYLETIFSSVRDAIITIDSLAFNKRVVQGVKKYINIANKIQFIHYVAPTVWAWKPKRAKELAQIYDYLLCLFNFELKYFTKNFEV